MQRIPEWSIDLSTGNPSIDYLHQMLLVLARKTIQAYDAVELGKREFHSSLNRRYATADELFSVEEAVLATRGDPTFTQHRAEHDRYRERITELLVLASIGKKIDRDGLCDILEDWSTRHLFKTDMISKPYMVPEGRQ